MPSADQRGPAPSRARVHAASGVGESLKSSAGRPAATAPAIVLARRARLGPADGVGSDPTENANRRAPLSTRPSLRYREASTNLPLSVRGYARR